MSSLLPTSAVPTVPPADGAFALAALAPWHALLVALPVLAAAIVALRVLLVARGPAASAWSLARGASALSLLAAAASLIVTLVHGSGQAFTLRADAVGGVMLLLVTFIGWVIVRYSQPYLAAERHERAYVGWLMAALAAVSLVVVTNHLAVLVAAWTATSLALHRLLTFFRERPAAVIAAHKKFLAGRGADLLMVVAAALLYVAFGTFRIDELAARATAADSLSLTVHAAVVMVALAALLKCAQLPFHGWLIQVMEAPTPVSALLHAGVVNLGGFVLIRLASLVAEVPTAQWLLVIVGSFTAIVAALVMTTRISVKVMLAWSTCAQMGFMLMQCGLGLWELALLHLVAHSLYKAHAFLSAGGVVRQTMLGQLAAPRAPAGVLAMSGAALLGLGLVAALAAGWQQLAGAALPPALLVAVGIVALALTPLLVAAGGLRLWIIAAASAAAVAVAYFVLHALFAGLVGPAPASTQYAWLVPAIGFALLFLVQCAVTAAPSGSLARALYPWCYGGLFLDEIASRAVFRWLPPPTTPTTSTAALAAHASEPRPAIASGAAE